MTNSEGQKKVNDMISKLNPQEQEKLQQLLSDKAATDRLLATPQAQALLKQLMGQK